jgi:hypothetical protein
MSFIKLSPTIEMNKYLFENNLKVQVVNKNIYDSLDDIEKDILNELINLDNENPKIVFRWSNITSSQNLDNIVKNVYI